MAQYYGIERSEEYLEHYGIKGMKWGVQKAKESGSDRKLARQYRKAQKKLAKLEAKADSSKLIEKANRLDKISKGARIAGRVGLGTAAAATSMIGVPGHSRYRNTISGVLSGRILKKYNDKNAAINDTVYGGKYDPKKVEWGKQEIAKNTEAYNQANRNLATANNVSSVAQKVGAGLGLAGYGVSAAAKLRANALRKQASGYRHNAAVAEANHFRSEMNKAFNGTIYANAGSKKRRRH